MYLPPLFWHRQTCAAAQLRGGGWRSVWQRRAERRSCLRPGDCRQPQVYAWKTSHLLYCGSLNVTWWIKGIKSACVVRHEGWRCSVGLLWLGGEVHPWGHELPREESIRGKWSRSGGPIHHLLRRGTCQVGTVRYSIPREDLVHSTYRL